MAHLQQAGTEFKKVERYGYNRLKLWNVWDRITRINYLNVAGD
jgi:hypothetical protein